MEPAARRAADVAALLLKFSHGSRGSLNERQTAEAEEALKAACDMATPMVAEQSLRRELLERGAVLCLLRRGRGPKAR